MGSRIGAIYTMIDFIISVTIFISGAVAAAFLIVIFAAFVRTLRRRRRAKAMIDLWANTDPCDRIEDLQLSGVDPADPFFRTMDLSRRLPPGISKGDHVEFDKEACTWKSVDLQKEKPK